MVEHFNLFSGLNINPIPLEFSNSLTTTEILGALQAKVNELIKILNEYNDSIDNKIEGIEGEIESKVFEKYSKDFTEFSEIINNRLNEDEEKQEQVLKEYLEYARTLVTELRIEVINYDNGVKQELKSYIDEKYSEIEKLIGDVPVSVINPTNGRNENIQKVINDIYDALRTGAITAKEFDDLLLTAKQFEDINITAKEFDRDGKSILL